MGEPEIPSNVISLHKGGRPPGARNKPKPAGSVANKPTLNWHAVSPLVSLGLTEKQIACVLGLRVPTYRKLAELAYVNGKWDNDRAKALSKAYLENMMQFISIKSMPAAWALLKNYDPANLMDRMPASAPRLDKLSDDELEQAVLKLAETNPVLMAKISSAVAKKGGK